MRRRLLIASAAMMLALVGTYTAGEEARAPALAPASASRGAAVFAQYCALCHGATAHGDGRAARLHTPPPVDLTRSHVNDVYRELIIRRGSEGVGRSNGMPSWEGELSNQQIKDVIAYLGTISTASH
jgi:high-affinity iron transporter